MFDDTKPKKKNINIWDMIKRAYSKLGTAGNSLFAIILLIIVLSFLSPYFLSISNFVNIARQSAPLAIVSLGMTMVIISGGIDLSVASNISLNNVIMAILITTLGIGLQYAIILILISGVILGLFNGFLVTILKIPPIIATLATMISYSRIAWTISKGYGVNLHRDSLLKYLGSGKVGLIPVSLIVVIIFYIITHLILQRTSFGRITYGLGGNTEAVYLSGISVKKYTLFVFMFSGLFSALASILVTARVMNGHPNGGAGMELDSIAATVLGGTSIFGGVGNVWGTLIGVLTMTIIINGLNLLNINPYVQIIVKGLVLAAAVGISSIRTTKR